MTKDDWARPHLPDAEIEAAETARPSGERLARTGTLIGSRVPSANVR